MNGWRRWLQAPATHWLHRVLFQVHLWLGIGFGVYLLLISISGSAIVLRPQFSLWFIHNQVASVAGEALDGAALDNAVAEEYSSFTVRRIVPPNRAGRALYVELEKNGAVQSRYFDQYSGKDLGSNYPWPVASIEWLTRFHDELLLGHDGRSLNGLGGILLLLMLVSGLLIWWQGSKRWYEGLLIKPGTARGLLWQLHSFLGFWSLLLIFVWGFTAIYFAWPEPFEVLMDQFDPDPEDAQRPDGWLLFLLKIHFGRFRGQLWANILWMILGLLPAAMYISGFLLWYRRVLCKKQDSTNPLCTDKAG